MKGFEAISLDETVFVICLTFTAVFVAIAATLPG